MFAPCRIKTAGDSLRAKSQTRTEPSKQAVVMKRRQLVRSMARADGYWQAWMLTVQQQMCLLVRPVVRAGGCAPAWVLHPNHTRVGAPQVVAARIMRHTMMRTR